MEALAALALAVLVWLLLSRGKGQASYGSQPQAVQPFDFDSPLDGGTGSTIVGTPANPNASPSLLDQLAQAIGKMEGFGKPGAIPTRDNNPGDLTKVGGGFQTFATPEDGESALESWLQRHIGANPNWDFYDLFNYYLRGSTTAPPVDAQGDSDNYAEFVAGQMGVDPNTPVSSLIGGQS